MIPVKVLAVRYLANADPSLTRALYNHSDIDIACHSRVFGI